MRYFFTSDLHLGHANIIKYCNRLQFLTKSDLKLYKSLGIDKQGRFRVSRESLNNMNKKLIRRWNERVKQEDIVFHIGDFCFHSKSRKGEGIGIKAKEWESKLNGKIIFIKGNHDNNNSTKTIIHKITIQYGSKKVILLHDPIHINKEVERDREQLYFVGHVHQKWRFKRITYPCSCDKYIINVGVDVWNFYPRTFEEIISKYNQWRNKNG